MRSGNSIYQLSHNLIPLGRGLRSILPSLNAQAIMATKNQELLTLEGAKIAVAAAEKKAREIGVDMNIAVVDASTHLLHFSRMTNAKITSISSKFFLSLCFEEIPRLPSCPNRKARDLSFIKLFFHFLSQRRKIGF
jgi:hypothetical protein